MPLSQLASYLRTVLPQQGHRRREAQLRRGLARAVHQQTQLQLQRLRERRVVVSADRVCEVSNKPIGDAIFVAYPNNRVVLFNERSRGEMECVCPVTGRDFSVLPIDPLFEAVESD
eukprot:40464-Prymnesium_polylepis.1